MTSSVVWLRQKYIKQNSVIVSDHGMSNKKIMVRELSIVKVPRSDEILDKSINFAPLQNLHLDLLEVKKKLKKGLPAVIINKAPPVIIKSVEPKPSPEIKSPVNQPQEIQHSDEEGNDEMPDEMEIDIPDAENDEAAEALMIKELGGDGMPPPEIKSTVDIPTNTHPADEVTPQGVPDPYEGMSPEQIEAQEKEEYIWRFKILKKQYKERDIPSFNEHDDLPHMKSTYGRTIKEIHLENNVDSYRTYLVGGFMVMEFVFTNWVGADLTGFTSQQMLVMDKYDTMLVELGERSYNRWGSNFPIEIKLIGFIFMQAGLFYLGKIISTNAGHNIATIFNGLTGQGNLAQKNSKGNLFGNSNLKENSDTPVKKMRGPSIKVSDIKKETEQEEYE